MSKLLISLTLLLCTLVMSACGSPPKRTPYDGADQVGAVDPTSLVGNWKLRVLNPVADENASTVTQSYKPDGTWESIVIPPAEQTASLGPLEYKGYGNWQVNGDFVVSSLTGLEETTGNKLGGLTQAVASALMPKSTSANVYELNESRIIFVHEETGQAVMLERL